MSDLATTEWAATLSVPPHPAFLDSCRALVSTLAAQTTMGVDIIEDLRIAVDEAASMLLAQSSGRSPLTVSVTIGRAEVCLEFSLSIGDTLIQRDGGYAWLVLDAVTDRVTVANGDPCRMTLERTWNDVGQGS